ncbi:MAG TPA: NAD-dependent epimerase/dehydratase family protein, partial [Luteolibacter sp.]|nr:NAD-dependent epimerase/dehydratase family protein [Luteolibacter sp.]
LITGGAGFIGANLAYHHIQKGDHVVVVDDLSSGSFENISDISEHGRFRFVIADLLQWEDLCVEVARADRIYHLAAVVGMFRVLKEPTTVMRVNVGGTERLLEAAADCGSEAQIFIASSSSVYGHHGDTKDMCEDSPLICVPEEGGLAGYALSKLANEIQAGAYHREYGLRVIIPRFFNVAGPRQTGTYGFVIPRFIRQALAGRPLTVFGDGSQIRSFCDVRDTIKALEGLAALEGGAESPAHGQVVNVGNDREISILDLAKLVIERSDSDSCIEFVPFDQAYGEHFDHITQRRPDLGKLKRLTGFTPEWSLEDTIDDLLENHPTGGLATCASS